MKIKNVDFNQNVYDTDDEVFIKYCRRCKLTDTDQDLLKFKRKHEKEVKKVIEKAKKEAEKVIKKPTKVIKEAKEDK